MIRQVCVAVAAVGLSLAPAGRLASQAPVLESTLVTTPIPVAAAEAYEPCTRNLGAPGAWCPSLRAEQLETLERGRFEAFDTECRLVFEDDASPTRFVCGVLLIALRPRIEWTDLRIIREAADGEWLRISGSGSWMLTGRLHVSPGTERSALRQIMFHPMIIFAELNAVGGVLGEPR